MSRRLMAFWGNALSFQEIEPEPLDTDLPKTHYRLIHQIFQEKECRHCTP